MGVKRFWVVRLQTRQDGPAVYLDAEKLLTTSIRRAMRFTSLRSAKHWCGWSCATFEQTEEVR